MRLRTDIGNWSGSRWQGPGGRDQGSLGIKKKLPADPRRKAQTVLHHRDTETTEKRLKANHEEHEGHEEVDLMDLYKKSADNIRVVRAFGEAKPVPENSHLCELRGLCGEL